MVAKGVRLNQFQMRSPKLNLSMSFPIPQPHGLKEHHRKGSGKKDEP